MEVHIGKMIRERIGQRSDLTIKVFAEKLGVHEQTVYDIYKRADVSTDLLRRISEILEIPISDFFQPNSEPIRHYSNYYSENKELTEPHFQQEDFEKSLKLQEVERFIAENRYISPAGEIANLSSNESSSNLDEKNYDGMESSELLATNSVDHKLNKEILSHQISSFTSDDSQIHKESYHSGESETLSHQEIPSDNGSLKQPILKNLTDNKGEDISLAERLLKTHQIIKNPIEKSTVNNQINIEQTANSIEREQVIPEDVRNKIKTLQERLRLEMERNKLYEKIIADKEHIIRLLESVLKKENN